MLAAELSKLDEPVGCVVTKTKIDDIARTRNNFIIVINMFYSRLVIK